MKRTTVLAEESLLLEVKQLAEELNKSFTEVVREALQEYLASHRPRPRRISFAGIGRSGRDDLSTRAEEILEAEADRQSGWS